MWKARGQLKCTVAFSEKRRDEMSHFIRISEAQPIKVYV